MHIIAVLTVLALLVVHPIDGDFREDVLNEHNRLRKKHGVQNLVLDNNLSTECEETARKMAFDANPQLPKESEDAEDAEEEILENWCCVPEEPLECVQTWYDTIKYHDFEKAELVKESNPFYLLVWKSHNRLGVGQAVGNTYKGTQICVVVKYDSVTDVIHDVPKPIPDSELSTTPSNSTSSNIWNSFQCSAPITFSWLAIFLLY